MAGPILGNKIDLKPPHIVLTAPPDGAVYQLNDVVNATFGCQEAGSGLVSCIGTAANGTPIDTSSPGTKTFVVSAADAIGNTSSTTVRFEVKRTLTASGPARIWIGLTNSDDAGLRLDLQGRVLVNGVAVASGALNNVSAGSSGFNNAVLQTIALSLATGAVDVPASAHSPSRSRRGGRARVMGTIPGQFVSGTTASRPTPDLAATPAAAFG